MLRTARIVYPHEPLRPSADAKWAQMEIGAPDIRRVYRLLRLGKLEGFKDGRAVRIYIDSVVRYRSLAPLGAQPAAIPKRRSKASPAAHNAAMATLQSLGVLGQR
ncbi:hypothetical protein [Ferrovibrio terrae]|uniref:hypothetical protein n=1 Tax=Ferrovibrio terrae TaxID=2594003 RepID=UPI00313811FC